MKTKTIDPETIDLDHLKEQFNRFRSEFSGVKDRLSGNASEALDQMSSYLNGQNMSSRLASIEEELGYLTGKLKGSGQLAVTQIEKQVNERPIASIAVAFGAGLLVAQLLRRR